MLITRNHRSSTLSASILAGVALSCALGRLGADVPATPQPAPIPVERGASGKIVDRMPGGAPPAAPRFAEVPAQAQWSMTAGAGHDTALASASWSDGAGGWQAGGKTAPVAAAGPGTSEPRPVHVAARPRRDRSVVAVLPPPRPATRPAPHPAAVVAAAPEKRPTVAARMIAFVGSLAHPL